MYACLFFLQDTKEHILKNVEEPNSFGWMQAMGTKWIGEIETWKTGETWLFLLLQICLVILVLKKWHTSPLTW